MRGAFVDVWVGGGGRGNPGMGEVGAGHACGRFGWENALGSLLRTGGFPMVVVF